MQETKNSNFLFWKTQYIKTEILCIKFYNYTDRKNKLLYKTIQKISKMEGFVVNKITEDLK